MPKLTADYQNLSKEQLRDIERQLGKGRPYQPERTEAPAPQAAPEAPAEAPLDASEPQTQTEASGPAAGQAPDDDDDAHAEAAAAAAAAGPVPIVASVSLVKHPALWRERDALPTYAARCLFDAKAQQLSDLLELFAQRARAEVAAGRPVPGPACVAAEIAWLAGVGVRVEIL